ncbi:MAG: PaREP1 family protein [Candidatus Jordarchaeales archaeon]
MVFIPAKLPRRLGIGIDLESVIVEAISEKLNMDPEEVAEVHLELAKKYLGERAELANRDPVQASEKLYKAAEEAVKAIANHFNPRRYSK